MSSERETTPGLKDKERLHSGYHLNLDNGHTKTGTIARILRERISKYKFSLFFSHLSFPNYESST